MKALCGLLLVVAVLIPHQVLPVEALTQANMDVMIGYIKDEIDKVPTMIGGLVRLAFHDCVGGCDACIQESNKNNNGLARYIVRINNVRQEVIDAGFGPISKADFWILAYQTALWVACNNVPNSYPDKALPLSMVFKYGRGDHQGDCPHRYFPGPNADPVEYLMNEFGVTELEGVALMGAHTVGKAHSWASGYRYRWTTRQHWFNNEFFKTLSTESWYQRKIKKPDGTTGHQWTRQVKSDRYLMLPYDMKLYLNPTIPKGETKSTCIHPKLAYNYQRACGYSKYIEHVLTFAESNRLFVETFVSAMNKVTRYGYKSGDLRLPTQ